MLGRQATRSSKRNGRPLGAAVHGLLVLAGAIALAPITASALGVALSPVGGSTTGLVGQTMTIGIDLVIPEGEFVTIADPALQWDLEGGNVLDVVGASQTLGLSVGSVPLSPLAPEAWQIFDPSDYSIQNPGERVFGTGPFGDTRVGPTGFWGFEMTSANIQGDQLLEVFINGAYEPGTYRIGTIDLLLRSVGTTTISYVTDESIPWRTFFTGSNVEIVSNDELDLTPLDVSSIGFSALSIVVVPEPGTALLLGLGLAGLSASRRRRVRNRD